jgi:O-antigen ligase
MKPTAVNWQNSSSAILMPPLTRRFYPLRYWIFAAYLIGVPNFIRFDNTGLTHTQGLFNVTSLSFIALSLITGFFFAVMTLLNRHRIVQREVNVESWLWVLLWITFLVASVLQPASRLTPYKPTDLLLSVYRLGEWILAFTLLLSLYTREPAERGTDLIIRLMSSVCWFNVILVWIALPFLPSLVYASPGDATEGYPRLGGMFIHPVHLSVLAGVAFFHGLIFMRGPKRFAACSFAFVTVVLTYARSELAVVMLGAVIYALFLSRSVLLRYATVVSGIAIAIVGGVFSERLIRYLERGQGSRNLTTLSERTMVWKASFMAIDRRPWIGYGYIAGAKNALKDHWNSTNWVPPHAHNELIQGVLSGGILAGMLILAIYGRAWWAVWRGGRGPKQVFLLIVLLQVTIMAFIMPLISLQFSKVSGLFLLTFFGLVAAQPVKVRKKHSLQVSFPGPVIGWRDQPAAPSS